MAVNIGVLAVQAGAAEILDLGRHAPPHKSALQIPERSVAARVSQSVGKLQEGCQGEAVLVLERHSRGVGHRQNQVRHPPVT